eukprot:jgi/Botrbrau1/17144/Bobra.0157s0040.2
MHPLLLDVAVIVIRSFGQSPMGSLSWANYPALLGQLKLPWQQPGDYINLATIDIFRDRERGVPRYNDFRKALGLKPFKKWSDFTDDVEVQKSLAQAYKDINKVDAVVGMLAEERRPPGFAISETALRVFVVTASRRLLCDRFYQEGFKKETYTEVGMKLIKDISMKEIILRHYPGLAKHIDRDNVFEHTWPGGAPAISDTTDIVNAALEDAGRVYVRRYSKKPQHTESSIPENLAPKQPSMPAIKASKAPFDEKHTESSIPLNLAPKKPVKPGIKPSKAPFHEQDTESSIPLNLAPKKPVKPGIKPSKAPFHEQDTESSIPLNLAPKKPVKPGIKPSKAPFHEQHTESSIPENLAPKKPVKPGIKPSKAPFHVTDQ